MKIQDIVMLVKAGYTPGEIGTMENKTETMELLRSGIKKEDIAECLKLVATDEPGEEPATEEPTQEEPTQEETKETEPDYKTLYTDLLKKQQHNNVNTDMSNTNEKTDQETINDFVRSFM